MPLTLEIVTPEGKAFTGQVDDVVLPTANGDVDILPGHQPLLTIVEPGEVQATMAGGREYLAVDKGFARVQNDVVSVLCEGAINIQEIDLNFVEDARQKAEAALEKARKEGHDPAQIEKLESVARFAMTQQLVKRKKH
ncbi:ATP synthase F1 subunit epsilon [Ruficoccus amylovorans]|uniref:ATP synthase epsilon chain n=1 Tax=Ruficoccus amylovorans TaxID=1804625 RepID=A0A842HK33_9BACT|nr:ATP synthase F1 subunit epsilon [Ruficoccus amylovorans]MBC2595521.1 ATP synthase F1 subunit epsilon [Ruficoccus amylovorans]